jgi:hypothetical protein
MAAFGPSSAEGAELHDPGERVSHQIVVVNQSVTPVRVSVEDSNGHRYELGVLNRGETKMFEAPADVLERGDFRIKVHPRQYAQRFRDPVSIATNALNVDGDETVILWLEGELSQSKVEVRAG